MANECAYKMKIKGSKESCEEWLKRMEDDNAVNFEGFYDAFKFGEGGTDDDYYMKIGGECAWSLQHCNGDDDSFGQNSKELNITMEAFSYEPYEEFTEHYLYRNGVCEIDECGSIFPDFAI